MTDLPTSWHICTFGDVASIRNGFAFKSTDFLKTKESPEDIPLVRQSQLVGATVDLSNAVFLPAHFFALHQGYVIETGDLIIGMSGSIGAVCQYKETVPALQNQRTGKITLRFKDAMSDRFFGLFLKNVETELKKLSKGMGVQNISGKDIEALSLALPPLPEQHRIVAKIEELFSELDAGTASLTRARAQLKTYRQALLKAAFEGKLTAPWRAANPDKLESPETLLSRIRKERDAWYRAEQENWETRCAEWNAKGRVGPRPSRPDPYSPTMTPSAEELKRLPSIPDAWVYARLSDVACIGSGVSVSKDRKQDDPCEVAYLRVANVQRGHLDLTHMKTMPIEKTQLPSLALRNFDVLFNEGGDRDKLGRGWVWEMAFEPCITQNHVFRATLFRATEAGSKLLSHWGNSEGQDYFEKGGKQTTNLASINKKVLKALPVPVMSAQETEILYGLLEASLSSVDSTESEITTALARITALRQSILKKAFSGQLVAQDPADEPASILLARLAQAPAPKPRRKTKP